MLAAVFAYGTGTSQLALLAVVLQRHGISATATGTILATFPGAMIVAALLSSALTDRWGAARTMVTGGLISSVAVGLLPLSVASIPLSALAMIGRGLGFGLFTTAGQMMAKALASEDDQIRAVGMFSAMFLVPTFFGAALGEWALRHWGMIAYFTLATAPIAGAVALVALLPRNAEIPAPPDTAGYLALLRNRGLWLPNLADAQSGLAYAFASTFLPLMLVQYGTPVAAFFSPFAIVLLATRYLGLKYLQRLAAPRLAAIGLAAYAICFCVLVVSTGPLAAGVAGCLAAVGYGVVHPTCIEWASRQYPPAEQARPVALANTSFNLGAIVATQAIGATLALLGWIGVLILLAAIVSAVLAAVEGHLATARAHGRA